jgi:hypothetical protein
VAVGLGAGVVADAEGVAVAVAVAEGVAVAVGEAEEVGEVVGEVVADADGDAVGAVDESAKAAAEETATAPRTRTEPTTVRSARRRCWAERREDADEREMAGSIGTGTFPVRWKCGKSGSSSPLPHGYAVLRSPWARGLGVG